MDFSIASHRILIAANQSVSAESYLPQQPKAIFIFAHGTGAGMHHSFMVELSAALAGHGIATLRYQFLYMEQKKKRPDFPAVAHQVVEAAIKKGAELFPSLPLMAGGKSFGGRMTSQFLSSHTDTKVSGVIFVGFPLHPDAKPSIDRAAHLKQVKLPMLFLQGTKDKLAEWDLIEKVCEELPASNLIRLEGADHSFKAIKKQSLIPILASKINDWIDVQ